MRTKKILYRSVYEPVDTHDPKYFEDKLKMTKDGWDYKCSSVFGNMIETVYKKTLIETTKTNKKVRK